MTGQFVASEDQRLYPGNDTAEACLQQVSDATMCMWAMPRQCSPVHTCVCSQSLPRYRVAGQRVGVCGRVADTKRRAVAGWKHTMYVINTTTRRGGGIREGGLGCLGVSWGQHEHDTHVGDWRFSNL